MLTKKLTGNDLAVSRESTPPPFQGTRTRLRVHTEDLSQRYYGKVFNDLHVGSLSYHLVPHQPYHSFIEGRGVRIESDRDGRPVFVSISHWRERSVAAPLSIPTNFDLTGFRFLDIRIFCDPSAIEFDEDNSLVRIVFGDIPAVRHVALEPHAIWSIDTDGNLAALWLRDITLDPSGKRFLKWRRRAWAKVRRDYRAGRLALPIRPTPLSASEKITDA